MVKINISQNVLPAKPCPTRVAQEKPVVSKLEVCQNNSNISSTKSTISVNKTHAQVNSAPNVNHVDHCVKTADHQTVQQKKISPKKTTDKNTLNKSKQATFPSPIVEELKCNLNESTGSTNKAVVQDLKPFVKTDTCTIKILEKNFKDICKRSKIIPKKKNTSEDNKMPQLNTTNAPGDLIRKKVSPLKIPKKSEKQKSPSKSDLSNSTNNKVVSKNEKDQITNFSDSVSLEMKNKNTKLNDIANKPKSVQTNDSQESVSDLSVIAKKDEDLRVKPMSLKEDTSLRMPKRDIVESSSLSSEMEKLHPPRKKIRGDDAENCNPENR